ncbi:MAG: hydroxymethylbilane synthase [Chthoniobacter sp.]|uniref:hydroxymethylbilane synthase n=1 Tax=Chthoniobacter sp. TaxID=2510640 RepID=UPI0032A1C8A0
MNSIILGTRASALALAQVELTAKALAAAFPGLVVTRQEFVTRGDKKLDLSLIRANEAGGKGLFTKELEDALLNGAIDVAVHSLKDLPGHNPPGLEITAVLERAPTADVLITREPQTLRDIPQGVTLGTSSVRRARQLQWLRPDVQIVDWRGNVQTRLRKLAERSEVAGIILAQAGLERLGHDLRGGMLETEQGKFSVTSLSEDLLPAIGQGAIALQSRADRAEVTAMLQAIDHRDTHFAIRAERELQRLLSGDCALPVGVRTKLTSSGIAMRAILFGAPDAPPKEAEAEAATPEAVAAAVFADLERP